MENYQELLTKLEKHSRQQLLFTKVLCILCAVAVVCLLVLTVLVTGTASHLAQLAEPLQEMALQAESVMDNLTSVTQALADADLGSMVENVNILASQSQNAISEAMAKLDAIDIDALNQAIRDLADIVEPLAKISNFWG